MRVRVIMHLVSRRTHHCSTITEQHEEKYSEWNCTQAFEEQRTQPNQDPLRQRETTDGSLEVSQMRNLFVIDLVFPHANFVDRLVENVRFGLVDWIHGLVGKQVDTGWNCWIAGRVDTRGDLFLHLCFGHRN